MVKNQSIDGEAAILEHICRYRITVPEAVAGLSLLGNKSVEVAQQTLDVLVTAGRLQRSPLVAGISDRESYYYLSTKAATTLGVDLSWASRLRRDELLEHYARAIFCCTGTVFRQLFTRAEFVEKFASIWFPGQPLSYYLERQDDRPVRLAYLKLDRDGHGRWERLIDSCSSFLRQRTCPRKENPLYAKQVRAFSTLVAKGQFQFTVLTAVPEKKLAIELELDRRSLSCKSIPPIEVHVVPGLLDLLYPPPQVLG